MISKDSEIISKDSEMISKDSEMQSSASEMQSRASEMQSRASEMETVQKTVYTLFFLKGKVSCPKFNNSTVPQFLRFITKNLLLLNMLFIFGNSIKN